MEIQRSKQKADLFKICLPLGSLLQIKLWSFGNDFWWKGVNKVIEDLLFLVGTPMSLNSKGFQICSAFRNIVYEYFRKISAGKSNAIAVLHLCIFIWITIVSSTIGCSFVIIWLVLFSIRKNKKQVNLEFTIADISD